MPAGIFVNEKSLIRPVLRIIGVGGIHNQSLWHIPPSAETVKYLEVKLLLIVLCELLDHKHRKLMRPEFFVMAICPGEWSHYRSILEFKHPARGVVLKLHIGQMLLENRNQCVSEIL
ncbi:MAG: hypothetical protein BWY82_02886 [Verrucomicrobia bacterium ADurb.Bin474]|nr:MAG: hypothetical protein BWY82_02886 [Verrucomicrobia bacterium ADurb.Bin474]